MRSYPVIEFESEIDESGTIRVPKQVAAKLGGPSHVTVRLSKARVSKSLRARSVTEDEIESIALMQLEGREGVILFLENEGALSADAKFARRAAGLWKKKK